MAGHSEDDMEQPDWLTWAFWARDPAGIRDLVLTVGAFFGFILLVWRTWNVHRQANVAMWQAHVAQQRLESQVDAERERRITESFTSAVEQLGSVRLETRLGAVYTLERIARESRRDHWPIMETLTAYVRERSEPPRREADETTGGEVPFEPALDDVQAVFTVLGRRQLDHEQEARPTRRQLNLTGAYLYGVNPDPSPSRDFGAARLWGAILGHADLAGANLQNATLVGAQLYMAMLQRANLEGAMLTGAHLRQANLEGSNLKGASLERACLIRACLEGANLDSTMLSGTNLEEAYLEGADLSTAHGLTQEQLNSAIGDENTKIPKGLSRPAHWLK